MFNGPIPGESLTREKGNAPWEQPPQYNTVEEVYDFYMDKLEEDDNLVEEILFLLSNEFPLDLLVESILMNNEMAGKHSIDISFLIGPVLHEYLLSLATTAGINVKEFQGADDSMKQREKKIRDLKDILGSASSPLADQVEENLDEAVDRDIQNDQEGPAMEAPKNKGLMARRA